MHLVICYGKPCNVLRLCENKLTNLILTGLGVVLQYMLSIVRHMLFTTILSTAAFALWVIFSYTNQNKGMCAFEKLKSMFNT